MNHPRLAVVSTEFSFSLSLYDCETVFFLSRVHRSPAGIRDRVFAVRFREDRGRKGQRKRRHYARARLLTFFLVIRGSAERYPVESQRSCVCLWVYAVIRHIRTHLHEENKEAEQQFAMPRYIVEILEAAGTAKPGGIHTYIRDSRPLAE